jgi:hypothetical protein
MPADEGVWLDDVESAAPTWPDAAEDVPDCAVSPAEGWPGGIALQDLDLMAQGSVFDQERSPGSEGRRQRVKNESEHHDLVSAG